MLPFLSFMAVGSIAAAVVRRARTRDGSDDLWVGDMPRERHDKRLPPGTFQVVAQKIVYEESLVLATENVPMDNRFGNQPIVSEHEFARSAKVVLALNLGKYLDSVANVSLLSALKTELHTHLARRLGVEMDAQILRHIRLRFTAAPGHKVCYRVVWKQSSQRGLFEVGVGRHVYQLPYMVTYGLSHAVQSIAMEGVSDLG